MLKSTEDILNEKFRENRSHTKLLERLLAICVSRLGGSVVITPDDDDFEVQRIEIHTDQQHATTIQVKH